MLLDVPELGESLFDLFGSSKQIDMTAFELGLHRGERLEHRLDDAFLDRFRSLWRGGIGDCRHRRRGWRVLWIHEPCIGARLCFAPAEGGYLRLDNTTGQVSFCSERSAGWACQLAPDDRAALDSEIARLQGEIDRLKTASTNAEPPRPQAELTPRAGKDDGGLRFPTREEMERARAAVERAWRHFVDMVYDFQKDVTKKD